MGLDLCPEVAWLSMASEHGCQPSSAAFSIRPENVPDRSCESPPFRGLPDELFTACLGQSVEASLAIICGGSPLCNDPTPGLEALQRRIERTVLDEQFIFGS